MLRRIAVPVALLPLLLLVACGSDGPELRAEEPSAARFDDVRVETTDEHVVPVGGQSVAAGRVLLYGSYAGASDGSGDLRRSDELVVVDLESGATRWVGVPEDFWIAQAVATPAGVLVVGGPCAHGDVVPAEQAEDLSCPERVTSSYRMDWESEMWEPVGLGPGLDAAGTHPYVANGGLVALEETAYLTLRTSRDASVVLALDGDGEWARIAEVTGAPTTACATADGLVALERHLNESLPDQVTEHRLVRRALDGTVEELPLPEGVPTDSYGGLSTALGCLAEGPVVLHGGATPTEEAPVRVRLFSEGRWADLPSELLASSSGGLPSHVVSNNGSLTFGLFVLSAGGVGLDRTSYLVVDGRKGVERIDDVGGGPSDALRHFYDSNTDSVVSVGVSGGSAIIGRSERP